MFDHLVYVYVYVQLLVLVYNGGFLLFTAHAMYSVHFNFNLSIIAAYKSDTHDHEHEPTTEANGKWKKK